ncbi:MAG TPA: DEAD/DEAH box helicase, partial [Candidatus Sumerlaeia bacterium]|nr:DEAD/DEAH box helicase [Candidatus Sumerlaeia bacterium]
MTITIEQLISHGISERVVALWRQSGIEALLPLQEEAVMRTGVLQNKSLIVFAPTSSGKTFIAELAALKHLEANRKVIYLVPTKALAEEKYRRFRRLYAPLGYRVLVATRERPDADAPAMEGRFDLLIAVYEKMKSFLVQRPEMLSRAGLAVADEVQMLGEPERGGVADLLLTKVTRSPYKPQFIGLSAVLGDALRLAQWLGCDLLKESRRPVELREGVFDAEDGEFYYKEFNSGVESRETLCPGADNRGAFEDEESYAAAALGLAVYLAAERGEQVLIFVPTRAMSRNWAQKAAAMTALEPAEGALEELGKYEETRERGLLASCFQKGTAFHNSDLTWGMRKLIEEQYNSGGIRLLVSTSTLGEGVNLTGRNVIHVPEMVAQDEWTGRLNFVPLSHARFRNQGGRAGRFGRVSDFGRSILVAAGREQAERLMREYIHGELEPLNPPMREEDLGPAILDLVASRVCRGEEGARAFLLQTYTGLVQWSGEPKSFEAACAREIERLAQRHFLAREEGGLFATGIGAITAASGIRLGTASLLLRWLREVRDVFPFEALIAAAFTPDAAEFSLPVSRRERREINYPETARGHLSDERIEKSSVLREIFNRPGGYSDSDFSAFKKAVVLHEWIGAAETLAIEGR